MSRAARLQHLSGRWRVPAEPGLTPAFVTACSTASPAPGPMQCNLGTVSRKNLKEPCPKIDTDRAKKQRAAAAAAGGAGGFRWPWQQQA